MSQFLVSFSGVFVNTATVIAGSLAGLLMKKGIPESFAKSVMTAMGLCTLAIGITGVLKGENQLVMVLSVVFGVVIGNVLKIADRFNSLGDKVSRKFTKNKDSPSVSEGFITASLLFCVGAMTIVGSVNAGISGDNKMIYTKAVMDMISACMLSASLGIGVLLSAAFVFLFQGSLVGLAMILGSFLSDSTVNELICTGSVLIMALGFNLTGITKIKAANLLPALILVPLVEFLLSFLPV